MITLIIMMIIIIKATTTPAKKEQEGDRITHEKGNINLKSEFHNIQNSKTSNYTIFFHDKKDSICTSTFPHRVRGLNITSNMNSA